MQDKNWTDDTEFWDEAWSDMEGKLDDQRRTRTAWWWLAGVLILLMSVGTLWYVRDTPAAAPIEEGAVAQVPGDEPASRDRSQPNGMLEDHPTTVRVANVKTGNEGIGDAQVANLQRWLNGPAASTPMPANGQITEPRGSSSHNQEPTEETIIDQESPVGLDIVSVKPISTYPLVDEVEPNTPGIVGLPTKFRMTEFKKVSEVHSSARINGPQERSETAGTSRKETNNGQKHGWGISAYGYSSLPISKPGYAMELNYGFKPFRPAPLSFTVGLGYGRYVFGVKELNLPVEDQGVASEFDVLNGRGGASEYLTNTLGTTAGNDLSLTYSGPMASIRATIPLFHNFSLLVGGRLSYLTQVDGAEINQEGNNRSVDIFALSDSESIEITNFATDLSATPTAGFIDLPRVKRFQAAATVGLNYHLGVRWQVTLEGAHLVTPVSDIRGVDVDRTQLGLGLRYRIN